MSKCYSFNREIFMSYEYYLIFIVIWLCGLGYQFILENLPLDQNTLRIATVDHLI